MNKQVEFVRVRFSCTEHDENIQAFLIAHDPLGFLEEDDWWEVYFPAQIWTEVEHELAAMLTRDSLEIQFASTRFEQQNWNKQWEESILPIQITDNILITPSWHAANESTEALKLIIDPKMSFGTGYHATTRLMLRVLEGEVNPGSRALDVGTGTGVLAIAAVLMGAAQGDGVDTDEWSYDNAMENAQRNQVEEKTRFFHGSIECVQGPYDLVLSNITKIDNMDMMPRFHALLNPGGKLILSGFYSTDMDDVRTVFEQLGLRFVKEIREDEWSAILAVEEGT